MSALLLWLACANPYPSACKQYEKLYCDTCELSDQEKTYCTCIENGTLSPSDFVGQEKPNEQDAQMQCDAWLNALKYPAPSQSTRCQQDLVLMREHKAEVCPQVDTGFIQSP